ncbi:MAG: hypothetical protein ABIZ52_08925 [Candidatus Limnocylindrales bacterium]
MFATLLGALPRPDAEGDVGTLVELVIRVQEDAGLEPITDGRLRDPGFERLAAALDRDSMLDATTVEGWRFAAGLTEKAVKQALPGPYTLGHRKSGSPKGVAEGARMLMGSTRNDLRERERRTMAYAHALRREVDALAAAGCPLIEIEEADAHRIGSSKTERGLFRDAHHVLTEGVIGTHLSLSIVGQAAASAGVETILAAPYASLAVDLIEGPDNWNLVTRTPGDRGIVVGALGIRETHDEPKEVLLWAAHYAASTAGRGNARIGIGSAGSYANLTWAAALRKLQALGTAARLAALPPGEELANAVDPRSISARRAALGSMARRATPRTPEPPKRSPR